MAQRIFRNDHGAVDNQAEIERTETHQVCADPALQHSGRGHEHGQRNDERGNKGCTDVTEQEKQHGDDEKRALSEIPGDGLHSGINQLGAIENSVHADACRQRSPKLLHAYVHGGGHRSAVGSDQHQGRSDHHLLTVAASAAGPDFAADGDVRDIANTDRYCPAGDDRHVCDIGKLLQTPAGANRDAFAVAVDGARASADIVGLDGAHDIAERQTERDEFRRVRLHLILLDVSADGIDAGNAGNGLDLWANDPVLHRSQIGAALDISFQGLTFGSHKRSVLLPAGFTVAGRRIERHGPHVYFAKAGRDRTQSWFGAGRQAGAHIAQPLTDLLTREINVGLLAEDRSDLRKAVARQRTRRFQPGNAGKGRLDAERDLLFDLDRGKRGCCRVDLYLLVGDVRNSIDWKMRERPCSEDDKAEAQQQHKPAVPDGQVENAIDHDY